MPAQRRSSARSAARGAQPGRVNKAESPQTRTATSKLDDDEDSKDDVVKSESELDVKEPNLTLQASGSTTTATTASPRKRVRSSTNDTSATQVKAEEDEARHDNGRVSVKVESNVEGGQRNKRRKVETPSSPPSTTRSSKRSAHPSVESRSPHIKQEQTDEATNDTRPRRVDRRSVAARNAAQAAMERQNNRSTRVKKEEEDVENVSTASETTRPSTSRDVSAGAKKEEEDDSMESSQVQAKQAVVVVREAPSVSVNLSRSPDKSRKGKTARGSPLRTVAAHPTETEGVVKPKQESHEGHTTDEEDEPVQPSVYSRAEKGKGRATTPQAGAHQHADPAHLVDELAKLRRELQDAQATLESQKAAFDRVNELYRCTICLETLRNPLALACGHVFCQNDLWNWFHRMDGDDDDDDDDDSSSDYYSEDWTPPPDGTVPRGRPAVRTTATVPAQAAGNALTATRGSTVGISAQHLAPRNRLEEDLFPVSDDLQTDDEDDDARPGLSSLTRTARTDAGTFRQTVTFPTSFMADRRPANSARRAIAGPPAGAVAPSNNTANVYASASQVVNTRTLNRATQPGNAATSNSEATRQAEEVRPAIPAAPRTETPGVPTVRIPARRRPTKRNLVCPHCREPVATAPIPIFVVREVADLIRSRSSGRRQPSLDLERSNDTIDDTTWGGLFKRTDREGERNVDRHGIVDVEDGVRRCIYCHWEITGARCSNVGCNTRYEVPDGAVPSDDQLYDSDIESDIYEVPRRRDQSLDEEDEEGDLSDLVVKTEEEEESDISTQSEASTDLHGRRLVGSRNAPPARANDQYIRDRLAAHHAIFEATDDSDQQTGYESDEHNEEQGTDEEGEDLMEDHGSDMDDNAVSGDNSDSEVGSSLARTYLASRAGRNADARDHRRKRNRYAYSSEEEDDIDDEDAEDADDFIDDGPVIHRPRDDSLLDDEEDEAEETDAETRRARREERRQARAARSLSNGHSGSPMYSNSSSQDSDEESEDSDQLEEGAQHETSATSNNQDEEAEESVDEELESQGVSNARKKRQQAYDSAKEFRTASRGNPGAVSRLVQNDIRRKHSTEATDNRSRANNAFVDNFASIVGRITRDVTQTASQRAGPSQAIRKRRIVESDDE